MKKTFKTYHLGNLISDLSLLNYCLGWIIISSKVELFHLSFLKNKYKKLLKYQCHTYEIMNLFKKKKYFFLFYFFLLSINKLVSKIYSLSIFNKIELILFSEIKFEELKLLTLFIV